jgi:NAD+ kinase
MAHVGILVKPDRAAADEAALRLEAWLGDKGHGSERISVPTSTQDQFTGTPAPDCPEGLDLMVTVGGDGTLLLGARVVGGRAVPILGINVGRLGFLTDAGPGEMESCLESWHLGQAATEARMAIEVRLVREGGDVAIRRVLNDAVVSVGSLARMVEIDSFVDGQLAHSTRADGFIVATPTGSTAYNLAAGGPLVQPSDAAMVLTPICPHTLSDKPIVVGAGREVSVRLRSGEARGVLTLDGQVGFELNEGDTLVCRRAAQDTLLVRTRSLDFFEVLRRKLGWGENGH